MSPAAEDVVIGAAYRALMRHYHPDTNPDPSAQARAREITAAYAVLRDPVKRAEYDAQRAAGDFWPQDNDGDVPRKRPPALRGVGIASALLALGLVGAVWTLAEKARPAQWAEQPQAAGQVAAGPPANSTNPVIQLEPESERLARLREVAEILSPAPAPPPLDKAAAPDPMLARPPVPARSPSRQAATNPKLPATEATAENEPLAALDTMAAGLSTQSMAHASDTEKELLLDVRDRSAAQRKACGSDSCVADSYVRQIRETSAIMESHAGPPK